MLNFRKVLCLSTHPDDIEFSMTGIILKEEDIQFTSLVFSTGSENDPVADETRWEECRQYWKDTSNINQIFLAEYIHNYSEEGWINVIEKQIDIKRFDAIFLPPILDTHYEHRLVHNIGMALTRAWPLSIVEYKSVSVLDTWIPNMFIPIPNWCEQEKINRITKFESQQKRYFRPEYMKAFHVHLNSLKKGIVSPIEQFRIVTFYP